MNMFVTHILELVRTKNTWKVAFDANFQAYQFQTQKGKMHLHTSSLPKCTSAKLRQNALPHLYNENASENELLDLHK